MRVLFLDIDGVVCLHEEGVDNWGENQSDDAFNTDCCRRLKEIIDATRCKLVLSSSWRLAKKDRISMLRQFAPFGITVADFIGVTPLKRDRGDEIMAFLETHPSIDSFVAVDDEHFHSVRFPAERLVLTEQSTGITETVKHRCIAKLTENSRN